MWSFLRKLFGKKNQTKPRIKTVQSRSRGAPSKATIPRAEAMHHELSFVQEMFIRIKLNECESRRSFFHSLLTGDIVIGAESRYLLRSLSLSRGKKTWHFIELNLRRNVLRELAITERKLRRIDALEAFSRRDTSGDETANLPDDVQLMENLRTYYGLEQGIDGVQSLLAQQLSPLFFCVDPESGAFCGFCDNPDDAFGYDLTVVKVATSSLFAIRRPRLHHIEVLGTLSTEAQTVFEETVRLINRIDQVQRIGICESIS